MREWNFRADSASADLLVATERHLPGRESEEHDTIRFQELFDSCEESGFIFRLNVFDDIVDEYDVETFVSGWHGQEIPACELSGHIPFCEIFLGVFYLVGCQIDACDGTSYLSERQQVAALTAADLQDTCFRPDVLEFPEIVDVKFPGSLSQLPEVPFPVPVSFLHNVINNNFYARKCKSVYFFSIFVFIKTI